MKIILIVVKIVAVLLLAISFSGCGGMLTGFMPEASAPQGQAKEYEPVLAFKKLAIDKLSETQSIGEQEVAAYPVTACKFKNGVWNKEFRAKELVFYGHCNAAGFADGFGGLFIKQPANTPYGLDEYSFGQLGKSFPAYVGDFKNGTPHGQGWLTTEAATRDAFYQNMVNDGKEDYRLNVEAALVARKTNPNLNFANEAQSRQQYIAAQQGFDKFVQTTYAKNLWIPKYVGRFENGVYAGQGVLFATPGILLYSGEFKQGKKHGVGREYYPTFYAEKENLASAKKLEIFAAEGEFKNDKLNGIATALLTQCKQVTAQFKNGKLVAGPATYSEPTRLDQSAIHQKNKVDIKYIYGNKVVAYLDKNFQLIRRGFVSETWEDDDYYFTRTGNYNRAGKADGEFVLTQRKKSFGDITNSKRVSLIQSDLEVFKTKFKNGKEQPGSKDKQDDASLDTALDMVKKLVKIANPAVDPTQLVKGASVMMASTLTGIFGDPCTDLGEMSANLKDKVAAYSSYYENLKLLN